jgi:hypothetical protein
MSIKYLFNEKKELSSVYDRKNNKYTSFLIWLKKEKQGETQIYPTFVKKILTNYTSLSNTVIDIVQEYHMSKDTIQYVSGIQGSNLRPESYDTMISYNRVFGAVELYTDTREDNTRRFIHNKFNQCWTLTVVVTDGQQIFLVHFYREEKSKPRIHNDFVKCYMDTNCDTYSRFEYCYSKKLSDHLYPDEIKRLERHDIDLIKFMDLIDQRRKIN